MDLLQSLSEAVVDRPDDVDAWIRLGGALIEVSALDAAQHVVARARASGPTTSAQWSGLGSLLLQLKDEAAALEALRAAALLDIDDPATVLLFARTALDKGGAAEVEEILTSAAGLAADPDRSALLAQACRDQLRPEEALEHALRALKLRDRPQESDLVLAFELSREVARLDVAEQMALALRQRVPDNPHYAIQLASILLSQGKKAEAQRQLGAAPSGAISTEDRARLGGLLLELDQPERAKVELQEVLRNDTTSSLPRIMLGRVNEKLGAIEEAIEAYRAALEVEPEASGVHARLGEALLEAGRFDEASTHLARAVAESPGDSALRALLTRALLMGGNVETTATRDGGLSGDLSVFHLEELLEFLGVQRSTGVLRLTSKGRSGCIRLYAGRVVQAGHPDQRSLSATLVAQGNLPEKWQSVLRSIPGESDEQIAHALISAGAPKQSVQRLVRARVEQSIERLLEWSDGQARFEPDEGAEQPPFDFAHQEILMSVLTRQDEARR